MLESITVLGRELPTYGITAVLGFLCCMAYVIYMAKKKHLSTTDASNIVVYIFIGAVIGGKLLYLLQHLSDFFLYPDVIFASIPAFVTYISGGFVFYGGLFGAVLACFIYAKQFHLDMRAYIPIFITMIPLFHFFGRIGCFLSGCCYGAELEGIFSIPYHSEFAQPVDAYRFPVQLWEAAGNLILWIVLHRISSKDHSVKQITGIYCVCYATLRFGLEFLRGDAIRGIYILSLSQWISIFLFMIGCYILLDKKQRILSLFQQAK